eukprot:37236_1
MSFFSKQAFAEDEDDSDSDIDCEFGNAIFSTESHNAPSQTNHTINPPPITQPTQIKNEVTTTTNNKPIIHHQTQLSLLFGSDSDSDSDNNTILAPKPKPQIQPKPPPLPKTQKPPSLPQPQIQTQVQPLEFVLPSNHNPNPHSKRKRKKKRPKKKFNYNRPFNHANVIKNDWKFKAGIVSTKVNNKQCPQAHPRSELNIQQRNQYVTLKNKEILNEEEQKEYDALAQQVKSEQNTFKAWLENFYKGRDQRHADAKELTYFAQQQNTKELLELVKCLRFNCLSYYFISPNTLEQVEDIIGIKKAFMKQNYAPKYSIDVSQMKLEPIQTEQCHFEFLAHLKEGRTKIPRWRIEDKYLHRKYNDDTSMLDTLPPGLDVYSKTKANASSNVTPHVVYGPAVSVASDERVQEILNTNPNSKDISVVIDESVMSLLIDIDTKLEWKDSFMIPFTVKPNKDGHILFMDKPCLDHEWRARYCNQSYYKRVFRSYLAQNMMKNDMQKQEDGLNVNIEEMLAKQKEWNERMSSYSQNPHFIYSMWRLNGLHCLIRTQTYGQFASENSYATLKVDYLNPHKQAFIAHHKMKDEMRKDDAANSLRNAESALYGVERLTDSERLQWFMQTHIRPNNKLIVGRMQIPSRKLISCAVIDHKTLLTDHLEHVYLQTRYNQGLCLMERLFEYLLNHCVSAFENKQCLVAYNAQSNAINIFLEYEENNSDTSDQSLFDFHGYIDTMCGQVDLTKIDYIAPYSIVYRGVMMQCHIPDVSPPANAELPRPCQMFLFHGFCPKYHAEGEECEMPHYRTHVVSHCWEFALYGGHCERGVNCEWPHLRQQQLINKGYEMFHVRQLINYCQDYYKNGRCKNSQSRGTCNAVHSNEQQLMHEFHTKYKGKQMRKGQLLARARGLETKLQLAQHQKFPGQRKKRNRKRNQRKNNASQNNNTSL